MRQFAQGRLAAGKQAQLVFQPWLPGALEAAAVPTRSRQPRPTGEAGQGSAAVGGGQPATEQPALAGGVAGRQRAAAQVCRDLLQGEEGALTWPPGRASCGLPLSHLPQLAPRLRA